MNKKQAKPIRSFTKDENYGLSPKDSDNLKLIAAGEIEPISELENAIDCLRDTLKEDIGYYESWKANIAMAFKDEYDRNKKQYKNKTDIHIIANNAANEFLKMFLK